MFALGHKTMIQWGLLWIFWANPDTSTTAADSTLHTHSKTATLITFQTKLNGESLTSVHICSIIKPCLYPTVMQLEVKTGKRKKEKKHKILVLECEQHWQGSVLSEHWLVVRNPCLPMPLWCLWALPNYPDMTKAWDRKKGKDFSMYNKEVHCEKTVMLLIWKHVAKKEYHNRFPRIL